MVSPLYFDSISEVAAQLARNVAGTARCWATGQGDRDKDREVHSMYLQCAMCIICMPSYVQAKISNVVLVRIVP